MTEWAGSKKKQTPVVTTIVQAIAILAAMGGYLARKSDPPVGQKILRRGYTRLQDLCEGYALANATTRRDE